MMQSAPISRAAATVLQEVLGDERVDGRHAGDVDDRDRRVGLDDALEQALHHDLRAVASPACRSAAGRRTPSHSFDDRRRELEQLVLLAADDLLARPLVRLGGEQARGGRAAPSPPTGRRPGRRRRGRGPAGAVNSGCLRLKMNVAVSVGEKPWVARVRDSSVSRSRTAVQAEPEMSASAESAATASISASSRRSDSTRSSPAPIRSERKPGASIWSAIHCSSRASRSSRSVDATISFASGIPTSRSSEVGTLDAIQAAQTLGGAAATSRITETMSSIEADFER